MATRPYYTVVETGSESWLGDINDAFSALFDTPFPIARFTTTAALPSALLYEDCFAFVEADDTIYRSDGVDWFPTPILGAAVADATAWTDATAQGEFNDLLQALRDANVIQ